MLNDLQTVRQAEAPFNLADLRVPLTYAYGDEAEYYRALASELEKVNPLITTRELTQAGHAAHLKNAEQLSSLIEERWSACASA